MERRLVLRVLNYWRHVAGDRDFPSLQDIKAADIPELWPNCYLLSLGEDEQTGDFIAVGAALAEDCDVDMAGKPLSVIPPKTLLGGVVRYIPQVIEKRVPISLGGEFTGVGDCTVLYRSIALPLSTDGECLDGIFGAANCRIVAGI